MFSHSVDFFLPKYFHVKTSYPKIKLPSLLIPNWAFWIPPLSRTSFPSLTTFPKHFPKLVSKKPAFWAYRHPAALAVSSTETLWLFLQPSGPPGSSTDRVLSGSWTTVKWPGNKDAKQKNTFTRSVERNWFKALFNSNKKYLNFKGLAPFLVDPYGYQFYMYN